MGRSTYSAGVSDASFLGIWHVGPQYIERFRVSQVKHGASPTRLPLNLRIITRKGHGMLRELVVVKDLFTFEQWVVLLLTL